VFEDDRGYVYESFNSKDLQACLGCDLNFVQDNHSSTQKGVLRGLHYQMRYPQAKLVRVVKGTIFDVVVDLRESSTSFGRHFSIELSAEIPRQLWVPGGFAHGFYVLSDTAEVLYKMSDYWRPDDEHCLLWNDPSLAIEWPCREPPVQSKKDQAGKLLENCDLFA
jgi:dTDP-4-dehydrorhamnose 3,5-epimerase